MARVTGPLMSMDAAGQLGGAIVFAKNKGRPYVRQYVIPANPRTDAQTGTRAAFKWSSQEWSQLDPANQATWEAPAAAANVSPFNAFTKAANRRCAENLGPQIDYNIPAGATPAAPTAPGDAVTGRSVELTWTDSAAGDAFGVFVNVSDVDGFTASPGNLKTVADIGDEAATLSNLLPGTYYYSMRCFSETGQVSAPTAQGSFVIV